MRVGSLFSGIGGFDLGLERAGMTLAWHAETDDAASRVLAHHWPEVDNLGDVTSIRVAARAGRGALSDAEGQRTYVTSGGVDLLCGGFPCQDLSVAGRRAGLSGERSGLFYEFARIADELRPTWVVIENVPGLLSSNDGRDMGTLLNVLADLGYADLAWRVVDSLGFGVPQRRRRLFVVGRVGAGACAADVLLECEGSPWRPPQSGETGTGAAATLTAGVSSGRGVNAPGRRNEDDVSDNLIPMAFTENDRGEVWEKPYTGAVTAGGGKPGQGYRAARIGASVRRLMPVECERLQGFPDGWTAPISVERGQTVLGKRGSQGLPGGLSDSARYRCLGNAVTVPVAEWLGGRIVRVESERIGGAA